MHGADKQKLKILQERKVKALSLPPEQQLKWKSEIDNIDKEIAELKNIIMPDHFNETEAFSYLLQETKVMCQKLCGEGCQINTSKLLEQEPAIPQHLNNACDAVEKAYELKDMELLKQKIEEYSEAFVLVKSAVEIMVSTGFVMIMPEEKEYQTDIFAI